MKKAWLMLTSSILFCCMSAQATTRARSDRHNLWPSHRHSLESDVLAAGHEEQSDVEIIQITERISIAAQISESQIAQLPPSDFRAVLNVRSEDEEGAISSEQLQIESLGIPYVNIPITSTTFDVAQIDRVLEQIEALPKPLLVHCGSGFRASFTVMMYQIAREGIPVEEAKSRYIELGFDFEGNPAFKTAMDDYFAAYSIE